MRDLFDYMDDDEIHFDDESDMDAYQEQADEFCFTPAH